MKNDLQFNNDFHVGHTVLKLVFVSGVILTCMYGVLVVFASACKILE